MTNNPSLPVIHQHTDQGSSASKPKRDLSNPFDTRDLKAGDAFAAAGNLDEAFSAYLRFLSTCEAMIATGVDARADRYRDQTLCRIGDLSIRFLLIGNFAQGLKCADAALARHPKSVIPNINRAHALMLLDRVEEARVIYLRYLGKRLSYGRCCNDLILDAHFKLIMSDHEHSLMHEIEMRISGQWIEDEEEDEDGDEIIMSDDEPLVKTVEPAIEPAVEVTKPATSQALPSAAAVLPLDIEKGLQFTKKGKLDEACDSFRRALTICSARIAEDANDVQAQNQYDIAVSELGHLAFDFLLKKKVPQADEVITEAISYRPDWLWLELICAHVLMLTARKTEALNIHRRNCGRTMDNGDPWGATIPGDFAALREAGYNLPIMDEIERQFNPKR